MPEPSLSRFTLLFLNLNNHKCQYVSTLVLSTIEHVRADGIDLICAKDFSCFLRDYIEMGNFQKCVFPFLGVQLVSVDDGYDNEDYKGIAGELDVVMKNAYVHHLYGVRRHSAYLKLILVLI